MQRNARPPLPEERQLAILGPKVVSPLTDAVRFIDRDKPHGTWTAFNERKKHVAALADQPFRRDVEQAVLSQANAVQDARAGLGLKGAVQTCRRDPVGDERVDLILHQGNQGRHDDRQTVEQKRGGLKTQRLAAARGQNEEGIPGGENRLHGLTLQWAE